MDRSSRPTAKQTGREALGPARPEEHIQVSVCMCWWNPGFSKKKKKGPVLECGGGGSDGGRNRWRLDRRKTWSIHPFLWTELQVFRDERPFPPHPPRTSKMVSLLFSCARRFQQPKTSSERRSDLEHVHRVVLCLCVLGGVCV